jgi:hypothetical protein
MAGREGIDFVAKYRLRPVDVDGAIFMQESMCLPN